MAFFSDFTVWAEADIVGTEYIVGIKGDDSTDDNIKITITEFVSYLQNTLDFGAGGGGSVDTANSPNANEYARFTDADTIEGRTKAEVLADLDLEVGTDFLSPAAIAAAYQPLDADLTTLAAATITAFGFSLLDDANAAAHLVTLGITADITEINYIDGVTSAIQTQLNAKQTLDATLTALAAFNTNGLVVQTAADTFAGRTLTGTAAQITVTNGDGVAGAPTLSISSPFSPPGDIQLLENVSILLDAVLSADGKWSGIGVAGTLGETVAFGEIVYFKAADSKWWLADADADSTAGAVRVACCVVAGAADAATTLLLFGKVRADAKFPTMTIGAPVYISTTTGAIQTAQPSGTDDVIRIIGYGNTADELFFNPSNDYMTHT